MKELTLIEKIILFFRHKLKTYFCSHKRLVLVCKADELLNEYCQYGAMCEKCGKDFTVIVEERNNIGEGL